MTSLRDKFVNGTLWAGGGRLFAMASGFLMTLVLARTLPPSDYGTFFVVFNTIIILATVGTVGMDEVVVRFASARCDAGKKEALRRVLLVCLSIVILGGVGTAILLLFLGPPFFNMVLHMPAIVTVIGIVAAWLFFATLQRQLAETFRGLHDIRIATLLGGVRSNGIINSLLACTSMLVLWAAGRLNLTSALLTMLGASVAVVAIALFRLRTVIRGCTSEARRTTRALVFNAHRALHEGWPLWMATTINVVSAMGVAWLASAFDTAAHVALFGIAQRFTLLLITPMLVVNAVLPPMIAKLHANGETERLGKVVRTVTGVVLIPSIGLLTGIAVAGKPAIGFIFGTYYGAAYPVLLIICVGQIVNIATGSWQVVMPMTGDRRQMLTASLVGFVSQAVLDVYFGLQLGILGVAIGFTLSVMITNIYGMCAVRVTQGIWTFAVLDRETLVQLMRSVKSRVQRITVHAGVSNNTPFH